MSDSETDTIQLDGKPVRVWDYIIQQAADHLALTKADYVTLTVVGGTCVSLYTGKSKPNPIRPNPIKLIEPKIVELPRAGKHSHHIKKSKKIQHPIPAHILDFDRIIKIFEDSPSTPITAQEIGDAMNFGRKDTNMRGAITRYLAELRVSKIIKPTSNMRIPSYVLGEKLITSRRSQFNETTIVELLQEAKRPLALGIIADKFEIPRADMESRRLLAILLRHMSNAGQLQHDVPLKGLSTYLSP